MRTLASAHNPWRQSSAAQVLAGELADLVFGCRLAALDMVTRRVVMAWAEATVWEAVEAFVGPAPDAEAYDPRTDPMQAWRDRPEREQD
jgi:hypothetical protein